MIEPPLGLTPGQRVAWHRVRRGIPQEALAGLVGRTEDWLSKIENDRAVLDRVSVIRALSEALGVSVFDLIGEPAPRRHAQKITGLDRLRSVLMDFRRLSPLLAVHQAEGCLPSITRLREDINDVMASYQASRYGRMLTRLPELLTQTQLAAQEFQGAARQDAEQLGALAHQAAAMILTKLGQSELAWISAQRGLALAERSENPSIIGSLFRSVIHSLHSDDRSSDAADMTRQAARYMRNECDGSPKQISVYGTLLLPGAVAAARAGDRLSAFDYLDEADELAGRLGHDGNHLWTAFGPTNIKIHRMTVAMALGDVQVALDLIPAVDTRGLPTERQVRHSLETVNARIALNRIELALEGLLAAERRAPEQIHQHVMSRQLVLKMRATSTGRRSRELADLARRMKLI